MLLTFGEGRLELSSWRVTMLNTTPVPQGLLESSSEKAPVSVACGGESPLDGICLSEADKTAVLTLIREEVKLFFLSL
jgi:hypothetical protein